MKYMYISLKSLMYIAYAAPAYLFLTYKSYMAIFILDIDNFTKKHACRQEFPEGISRLASRVAQLAAGGLGVRSSGRYLEQNPAI